MAAQLPFSPASGGRVYNQGNVFQRYPAPLSPALPLPIRFCTSATIEFGGLSRKMEAAVIDSILNLVFRCASTDA